MNRTIFLRELRVGLLQELVAAGIVLGVLAIGRWLAVSVFDQPFRDLGEAISLFMTASIALLAFFSGARTFTAESRRRQELFFCTLPISRTALWFSMVGGRLTAALPMAALLLLTGFSLRGNSSLFLSVGVAGLAALYPTLFASGCCLPLLFRRDAAPYLAGVLIIPPVLAHIPIFIIWGSFSDFLSRQLWGISVGILSAALFLLSWSFFQRGESQVRTRQLTNLMILGATLAMFFLVIGTVTLSPLLDGVAGPWTQNLEPQAPFNWTTSPSPLVSHGGRYLAVVETLRERPGISRVTIVETASGRHIGMHRWQGLSQVTWNRQHEVLRILHRGRSLETSKWTWLTLEGLEMSRYSLKNIKDVLPLRDGSDLLLDTSSRARLLRWESPKGFRVLAEIPEAGPMYQWSGKGAIVFQRSDTTTQVIHHVTNGTVTAVGDVEVFLKPYLSFLSMVEQNSGQRILNDTTKERLLEKPAFGGLSLPDKLALYLPIGESGTRAHLYDGALDREIPLPACSSGQAATPELIPTHNSPAFLIRHQCRHVGASGPVLQLRHFYYLPGSGSPKALSILDQILDSNPILLAYLDERTAIWRPEKGETWKILRDGQVRTLWPPQTPID